MSYQNPTGPQYATPDQIATDQGRTVDENYYAVHDGEVVVVRELDDYYQLLEETGYFENADAGESDGDAE